MSGLIDSTTGLSYGVGLESQTAIGGAGLINADTSSVVYDLTADDGATFLTADDGATQLTTGA